MIHTNVIQLMIQINLSINETKMDFFCVCVKHLFKIAQLRNYVQ